MKSSSQTSRNRKQDQAWAYLFERFDIANRVEQEGVFEIDASTINSEVGNYYHDLSRSEGKKINAPDARNLLKFDFKADLPEVFKTSLSGEKYLSIMPKGRNSYAISDFKMYEKLKYEHTPEKVVSFPSWISGLDPSRITSESVAQSVAEMSGMFNYVIEDVNADVVATLNGKKGTGLLEFEIETFRGDSITHTISGWQSEIDGIYESPKKVLVLETKQKNPLDFNVRQLFIPLKIYLNQMKFAKEVYTAYFTYVHDIFSFHVYEFDDTNHYNSLHKVKEYNFVLDTDDSNIVTTQKIFDYAKIFRAEPEPTVPFPQANDVNKMLDMIDVLAKSPTYQSDNYDEPLPTGSKEALSEIYAFDVRQSDYYGNLLAYFGYVTKDSERGFVLTELGNEASKLSPNELNHQLIVQMMRRSVFREALLLRLRRGRELEKGEITGLISQYRKDLTKGTVIRRASTVNSFVEWVVSKIEG
jgi:hypothetical protein